MKLCKGCFEKYDKTLTVCPHCGYKDGTPTDSTLHMLPGTLLNERYIIGKVLGYGGFGVTYIAYDCVLQMKTAVKEYLPSEFATRMVGQANVTVFGGKKAEQFEDGKTKFVDEARNLAKFHSSEGIVKIFNTFECNNTAYIVMELLQGETLAAMIEREKKIPQDKAIEMLKPIMMSLKEVHEKGIIHRDIAPDNIFITKDGRVKLIDFGASRYATTSHSRSLTVIIKPGFSPEEQYRSRGDQGKHTDVYSMAATLYKMITGVTPPDALERRAFFENKGKEILKPPAKYANDIDENVENAILNAMNVRIEDRTPDMDTFYKELTSQEPVKRRAGKIRKIDFYRWPLWAKIGFPTAAALIVTFLILLYAGFIIPENTLQKEFIVPEGQTLVPALINKELSKGEERLTEAQLQLEIIDKVNDYEIDENYVLTQSIHSGSIVPENTIIQVTVSTQEKIIVPSVIGLNKEEVLKKLEEMEFQVTVKEEYSSVIAENCIISQSLEADSEQNYGSEIEIVVSKGKDPNSKEEIKEVTLPDFVGKSYDEVIKQAEKLGIAIKVSDKKYSKTYAKDTVMEQNPKSGNKIKTDKKVELVISLGYEKITVPDVVYMTEEKATTALTSRGLKVKVTYKNDDTVAAGNVISQNPKAKSSVDPESTVNIVVSNGSASFKMPNVVGKSESEARTTLLGSGLVVNVTYREDDSKTEGEVIEQSVKSGTDVKKGQSVTITVCTHSSVVTVPDVVGKTQSKAESAIEDRGLTVNVNHVKSNTVEKGRVISQTPTGGSGVKQGSVVTIEVSDGKDTTATTTSKTTTSQSTSSKAASSKTTSSKTTNSTTSSVVSVNNNEENVVHGEGSASSTTVKTEAKSGVIAASLILEVGETGTVVSGGIAEDAVMSSSNTSVAVCNSGGTVTAVGVGTADITIEFNTPANATTVTTSSPNGNICKVTVLPTKRENTKLLSSGNCGDNGDNVQWELYESGTLYIFGNGNMQQSNWMMTGGSDVSWADYRSNIINVEIEYGVNSIGEASFMYCSNLENVSIPNSIQKIGHSAFYNCNKLDNIDIPDSVNTIGLYAFLGCSKLSSVTIPSSVTNIYGEAFENCTGLDSVYFLGDKPTLGMMNGSHVFDKVSTTIYYPRNNSTWNDIETTWDGGGDMTFIPYDP